MQCHNYSRSAVHRKTTCLKSNNFNWLTSILTGLLNSEYVLEGGGQWMPKWTAIIGPRSTSEKCFSTHIENVLCRCQFWGKYRGYLVGFWPPMKVNFNDITKLSDHKNPCLVHCSQLNLLYKPSYSWFCVKIPKVSLGSVWVKFQWHH